jgi:NADH-quinone oxidoreductase subunit L
MKEHLLVSLIPALPLMGALLLGIMTLLRANQPRGVSNGLVSFVALCGPVLAFAAALNLFLGLDRHPAGYLHEPFTWFAVGSLNVPMAFHFDRLSGVMALIVTFIGSLIHLYSTGYMGHERGFNRFFVYLNLFLSAMLVLVLAKSLPVLFLGWEGVGACSFLLIGYYFGDTEKAQAANKAFIVNRVGDWGFILGLLVLFGFMGSHGVWTLDLMTLKANAALLTPAIATTVALLLFVGASAKSAQIPLHVWLADAMAGPTPVSALIHAATMVTAGVYLLVRLSFVMDAAPAAGYIVATIGVLTAFVAATIAVTQTNIKKVLAYSTVSQLGFMFAAVGAGAYAVGIFHLMTHAFFKALLFLGAGAVIHAMHHEEDMSRFGGLRSRLPFTATVMLVGCLAIAGIPPLSGFFSKDAILYVQWERGWHIHYVVLLLTSGLTAFYMFRMYFLTFAGEARDQELDHHAHEGPAVMNLPLLVLAVGSVVAGLVGLPAAMGGSSLAAWLAPVCGAPVDHLAGLTGDALKQATFIAHSHEYLFMAFAIIASGAAIIAAYYRYVLMGKTPFDVSRNVILAVFARKWGFDDLYQLLFVRGSIQLIGWGLDRVCDRFIIDGVVNGLPSLYARLAGAARVLQTGAARLYAYVMMLGATLLFYFLLARFGV